MGNMCIVLCDEKRKEEVWEDGGAREASSLSSMTQCFHFTTASREEGAAHPQSPESPARELLSTMAM